MYRKVYYAKQNRKHSHCWNCGKEGTNYVVLKVDEWNGTGWLGYVAGYNANVARFCSVECLKESKQTGLCKFRPDRYKKIKTGGGLNV